MKMVSAGPISIVDLDEQLRAHDDAVRQAEQERATYLFEATRWLLDTQQIDMLKIDRARLARRAQYERNKR